MSRALIVVTVPSYRLLDPQSDGWRREDLADCRIYSRMIGTDQLIAIFQADAAKGETQANIRNRTTGWVVEAIRQQATDASEVYIAAHTGFVRLDQVMGEIGKQVVACAPFSHYRQISGMDAISDVLYRLMKELSPEVYQSALDRIRAQHGGATHYERFVRLSHHVARLFVPIELDLESWRRVDNDDSLLARLIETYQHDSCRLTLARAQFYDSGDVDTLERIILETQLTQDPNWVRAKSLLPHNPAAGARADLYRRVFEELDLLTCLRSREGMIKLKSTLQEENIFSLWAAELNITLAKLANQIRELAAAH